MASSPAPASNPAPADSAASPPTGSSPPTSPETDASHDTAATALAPSATHPASLPPAPSTLPSPPPEASAPSSPSRGPPVPPPPSPASASPSLPPSATSPVRSSPNASHPSSPPPAEQTAPPSSTPLPASPEPGNGTHNSSRPPHPRSPPSDESSSPSSRALPPPPSLPLPSSANPTKSGNLSSNKSSTSSGGSSGNNTSTSSFNVAVIATTAVIAVFIACSLVGAAIWFARKRQKPADGYYEFATGSSTRMQKVSGSSKYSRTASATAIAFSGDSSGPMSDRSTGNSHLFPYDELYKITGGFAAQNLLGEGGCSYVYKGWLPDGREVAVKLLKDGGVQGEREFRAEIDVIGRVHHRHLVTLMGYCIEDNRKMLVYDFVPNKTLHYHLHRQDQPVLDWPTRVKVAAGAARGIAYLHEDCHPRIIHRDIKSSNILLDYDFEVKVADFGLARLAMDAVTHVTTRVMGTFGYLAPEYASSGKLTEKSDVFSFGVVLLELITGKKPVDATRPLGDESLVEWARPLLGEALGGGSIDELVDPRLGKDYNKQEVLRMIEAAAACVRHSSSRRPRMSLVVRVLDDLADVDLMDGVQPGKSEMFNVANTADIRLFRQMVDGNPDDSTDFTHSNF